MTEPQRIDEPVPDVTDALIELDAINTRHAEQVIPSPPHEPPVDGAEK